MKALLGSAIQRPMTGLIACLVVAAIIGSMVGCGSAGDPTSTVQYAITISSTAGGSVTSPGEGTFTYTAGTVVYLVAQPDAGYQFVSWTGDVDSVGNVSITATTITMNGNYSIAAHFAEYEAPEYGPMVAAGYTHTVGLRSDGTVVAAGDDDYGQCDVGDWTDIIGIAAGPWHTVGLRSDGTVGGTGNNWYGQCNVTGWTDITQLAAGDAHTVGLKSDGTVIAAGSEVELARWGLL